MTYKEMSRRWGDLKRKKNRTKAEQEEMENLANAMDAILDAQSVR